MINRSRQPRYLSPSGEDWIEYPQGVMNKCGLAALVVVFSCAFFLSSCCKPYDNIPRQVLADEQLYMQTAPTVIKLWETNDISIHYNALDSGDAITFRGVVKIKDSVTYSFPRADFLLLYVYLLNGDGISTSRHIIRPNISKYNTVSQQTRFSKIIPKDADTVSFAFGYWGNFFDTDGMAEEGGGHFSRDDWEIYHSPFK